MLDAAMLSTSIEQDLESLHEELREQLPAIHRVAAALYDAETDTLDTFVHSSGGDNPLAHYAAKLSDVPSLAELAHQKGERVINDLGRFRLSTREHTRRIFAAGYGSSYTKPFFEGGDLRGFLFFDASEKDYLTEPVVRQLSVYAHLVSLILTSNLARIRNLRTAVQVALQLSNQRDRDTGAHLERMSRYCRLIARHLAPSHLLTDEVVELIFLFAPLHDIGKISIPDRILFKPGPLTTEEFEVMKSHVERGVESIEAVVTGSGLAELRHIDLLHNIVSHHHEAIDGSGYPAGLLGSEIPLEARIVAVADVFDALTSQRPYKEPWSTERAFAFLREHASTKFDPDCVDALLACTADLDEIRDLFGDDPRALESREGYSVDL